ncbi:MAG: HIT family protein [Lachnospiraceae bacterium]|nr:HIT family protein [Lachnospiraceae bacterium]
MDNCIFCKILRGEIPSTKLYEDENSMVILDISPAKKGHAILLAKEHAANLFELSDKSAEKILPVVKKVGQGIVKTLGCDGLNVLQNNGEASGQTVFHLHVHMIPRYKGDDVSIGWKPLSYEEGEMALMAENIKKNL